MPRADRTRMERISRAVEGANRNAVIAELGQELVSCRRAVEHPVERQVRRLRPVTGGELQSFDAELGSGAE